MNESICTLHQPAERILTYLSLECFVSTGELSQRLELSWLWRGLWGFLPWRKRVLHLTVVSFRSDNSQVFQGSVLRTRRNSTTVMNRHSLVRKLPQQPRQGQSSANSNKQSYSAACETDTTLFSASRLRTVALMCCSCNEMLLVDHLAWRMLVFHCLTLCFIVSCRNFAYKIDVPRER